MKSYHANSGAGLAGLTASEHPIPEPGYHEVLIRVRANSLNARELLGLRGVYPLPVKPDVVMGADGSGEIVAVGPAVSRVKIGDRVAAAMFPRWVDGPIDWEYAPQLGGSLDGMLSEYVVLSEQAVVLIPDHLSLEEAATLPCAAVTAWTALKGERKLQAGDTVLTLGSGGVSLFALQFAKLFGARVIVTTSSEDKVSRLKAVGADDVINYRTTPDWYMAVRELTKGRGVDQVVDVGGGTLEQSIQIGRTRRAGQFHWPPVRSIDHDQLEHPLQRGRDVASGFCGQSRSIHRDEPCDRHQSHETCHRSCLSFR